MSQPLSHEEASQIAWHSVAAAEKMIDVLSISVGRFDLVKLYNLALSPYIEFSHSDDAKLIQRARREWLDYEREQFVHELKEEEDNTLCEYEDALSVPLVKPTFPRAGDDEHESAERYFSILASLVPEGRLIAELLKEIKVFAHIIAVKHKLKTFDDFLGWMEAKTRLSDMVRDEFVRRKSEYTTVFST
ncbi:hypothetical protein JCM3766R1_006651 [Sporobolomyces carnicolor]